MRTPMAIAALAFASGIALAPFAGYSLVPAAVIFVLALITALLAFKRSLRRGVVAFSFTTLFLALGLILGDLAQPDGIPSPQKHERVTLHLLTTRYTNYGILCDADLEGHRGKVKLTLPASCSVHPGDIVAIPNVLNPLPKRGNYRHTLRYHDNLRHRGYIARANVFDYKEAVVTGHRDTPATLLQRYRDDLSIKIEKSRLDRRASALAQAMLLADREPLDPADRENFSRAGTAHILAVSGLHVGLLTAILWLLTAPLALVCRPSGRWLVMTVLLWLFAMLTGLSPSVVRATVMASALLLSLCLGRRQNPLNALGVAVVLILIFDPYALYEAGFQLSVLASAALILFASRLNPFDPSRHYVLNRTAGIIVVTLVATLATWALTAWHFGRLPIWFIPSNVVIAMLTPVFMSLATLHLLCLCFGWDPLWLRTVTELTHEGITRTSQLASIHHLPIYIEETTLWLWLIALAVIMLAWRYMKFGGKESGVSKVKRIAVPASLWTIVMLLAGWSIADATMGKKRYGEGLIVQRQPYAMAVSIYEGGNERIVELPAGRCSSLSVKGRTLLALDGDADSEEISSLIKSTNTLILLIGKNFRGDTEEIAKMVKPEVAVFSSGIYRKKRDTMIETLQEQGIRIHDLSEEPLWLFW